MYGDLDVARCAEALAGIRHSAPRAHALSCDVTREEDLQAAADWLKDNWQGVDVVVNNAGVAQMGGIDEATLSDWQWIVDINLLGVVRGCRAFAPLLSLDPSPDLIQARSGYAAMAGSNNPANAVERGQAQAGRAEH